MLWWRLVVLKFSKGQRGRIFCSALDTAPFSWRKMKQKNPRALRNARFHVLIINSGRILNIQFFKSKSAADPERTRSCVRDKESGWVLQSLWFECSTCWVNGKGWAGIASPPSSLGSLGLGLASLLFDVDAEFYAKPQTSPFPAIPLFLSLDWEWEKNQLQMLLSCIVCNFQWWFLILFTT